MVAQGVDVAYLRGQWPQYGEEWPKTSLAPATITFEDRMVVHLGDRAIELLHPGSAHTYGDTLVYLPQEKVLFTGDVAFHYLTPFAADGHTSHWIRVLDRITRQMDVSTIVPGHGPVGDKTALVETRRYLRLLKRTSRLHFDQGASVDEAASAMRLGEYADWAEPQRVVRNMGRMYQELRGELAVRAPS
jgi:cyclase